MTLAANIVVGIVAALHIYFMVLEMFFWTKPLGLRTFNQSQQKADDSAVLAPIRACITAFSPPD